MLAAGVLGRVYAPVIGLSLAPGLIAFVPVVPRDAYDMVPARKSSLWIF